MVGCGVDFSPQKQAVEDYPSTRLVAARLEFVCHTCPNPWTAVSFIDCTPPSEEEKEGLGVSYGFQQRANGSAFAWGQLLGIYTP